MRISMGDQERQVIFRGSTAKDIVALTEEFGTWFANGLGRHGQPGQDGFDSILEAAAHVINL